MLMYGRVVHKRVWKEVPKEGKHAGAKHEPKQAVPSSPPPTLPSSFVEPSTEPRDTPFVADGFLSVQDERAPGLRPSSQVIVALPSSSAYNAGDIRARHTEPRPFSSRSSPPVELWN